MANDSWQMLLLGARSEQEERDRWDWIEDVRSRLGLVTEVHRCTVYRTSVTDPSYWWSGEDPRPLWWWDCQRDDCAVIGLFCPSWEDAFEAALAHARSFMPEPTEPRGVDHLDWTVLSAFHDHLIGPVVPHVGAQATAVSSDDGEMACS